MRRRSEQTPTLEPIDQEAATRRAEAKRVLEAWVRRTGRKIAANEAGFRYEIRLVFNEQWRQLESADLDELYALAKELGPHEKTHAQRRQLGHASELIRQQGHGMSRQALEAKLTSFSELTSDDVDYLLTLGDEYRRPIGGAA